MTPRTIVVTAAIVCLGVSAPATAQSGGPGGFEIAAGATYIRRSPAGSTSANETTPTATPFELFKTSSTLTALTGGRLEVGLHMSEQLEVFGAASFGTRQFRVEATEDRENAAPVTASERLQQFMFTGGARWFFT